MQALVTPRSMTTSVDWQSPAQGSPQSDAPTFGGRVRSTSTTSNFIVLPDTYRDAAEWEYQMQLSTASGPERIATPCTEPSTTNVSAEGRACYHAETRLSDGRPCMLLDIGSVGNLSGDMWVQEVGSQALAHGRRPEQIKRDQPLSVSGVGNGSQCCEFNCKLPVALECKSGKVLKASYETPTVPKSMLPALLGLDATRRSRGIIDTNTLTLYLAGPGDYNLIDQLPPGTEAIQCELAPSGHLVIPCCNYKALDQQERYGGLKIETEVALPVSTASASSSR